MLSQHREKRIPCMHCMSTQIHRNIKGVLETNNISLVSPVYSLPCAMEDTNIAAKEAHFAQHFLRNYLHHGHGYNPGGRRNGL
jgi:hypothetical protein